MAPELLPEERQALEKVRKRYENSRDHLKPWRELCNQRYKLYRGVKAYREAFKRADRPDRDTVARELVGSYGADLNTAVAYSTVETILPRAVSNRPRGLVLPEEKAAEDTVENMRRLIERQQDDIDYELVVQDTAKSGFLFGLGVQKITWKRDEEKAHRYLKRATDREVVGADYVVGQEKRRGFDGPWIEDVDIYDFFWDPLGYSAQTLGWVIHRTWRSHEYVLRMIASGAWNTAAAAALQIEDVQSLESGGRSEEFDAVWRERMEAAGHTNFNSRSGHLHEVWEYHDGREVITVVDGELPVKICPNPYWHGALPFAFYRPTSPGIKQLQGLGEIEPIEDLIREKDTLRSQRRDNAALKLQQVFAFDEDAIEPGNLVFGAGMAIPVRGAPRDFLYPLNVGDIPHSSYREEQELQNDIDRTSGISDSVTGAEGGGGAAATATGVQLVQAAAGIRIQLKSRRLERETVRAATNQQIALNQQMIVETSEIRVERTPQPGELNPRYHEFIPIGPEQLAGRMSFVTDGGAMQPKNPAQDANLATGLWNALHENPRVDQDKLIKHYLEAHGIKAVETWLKPPEATVPAAALPVIRDRLTQIIAEQFQQDPAEVQQTLDALITDAVQDADGNAQTPSANGSGPIQ